MYKNSIKIKSVLRSKLFSNIDSSSKSFKEGREYAESNPGLLMDNVRAYIAEEGIEDAVNFIFGYNSKDKKADNFDEDTAKIRKMMPNRFNDEEVIYNGTDARYFNSKRRRRK